MLASQTRAQELKIGIWQEASGELEKPEKLNTMQMYEKFKDTPVPAIIEYVRDANSYTVILKETRHKITLRIAGAAAPRMPSRSKLEAGELPEPGAVESKYFVERHLLNRTVTVTITAPGEANRQGEFYGSVEFAGRSLSSQLIRNGYAKLVEWNAPAKELEQLKALQREAMSQKIRIWKHIEAIEAAGKRVQWTGRVREVRDGSSIIIQDSVTGEDKFVILSNVKVPRMTNSETQPFAYEARELIRKRVLGKKVSVVLDYSRNERDYCTVSLENKDSIAVLLVDAGLANVTSYDDNEKSSAYQELTIAENRARGKGKNLWSKSKAAPIYRVTDTTLRSTEAEKKQSKQKAKQFFGALQRAGRVSGIVEYVFNGSRLKISIPSENCVISFGLEALRTPTKSENEELCKEVHEFVYDKLQHRDVELIVDSSDQAGNFFGSLFINSVNFGVTLLEMGYARVNQSNVDYTNYAPEYKAAEEAAKQKGARIWANYTEAKEQTESSTPEAKQVRLYKVTVSEVIDGNWFYLQMTDDAKVLDSIMRELNNEDHPIIPNMPIKRNSTLYAAKMPDDAWYRVKVAKLEKNDASVVCVDFGNGITIDKSELRPLSAKLAAAPIQAKECKLAYLQIPNLEEDYGDEAAEFFYNLAHEKNLLASVEYIENGISYVGIGDGDQLINLQMVEAGFGIVPRNVRPNDARKQQLVKALSEKENEAKGRRVGRWELGDFRDDEEY